MRTRNGFKASALSSASASSTGEVTRRFACTPASKAALRAWPLVTGTACGSGVQGNDFQSLGKPAGFPLSRACARVRKKGILECRSLGTRRALALLRVPSHHLANDHQMTPPLFAGAFRAFGPFAPLTAARLSGTASRALRPKASCRAGLRGVLSSVGPHAACLAGELRVMPFPPSSSFDLWLSFRPSSLPHSGPGTGGLPTGGQPFAPLPPASSFQPCPKLRAVEALLPETKRVASRSLVQALPEG